MKVTANSRQYDTVSYRTSSRNTSASKNASSDSTSQTEKETKSSASSPDVLDMLDQLEASSQSVWEKSASRVNGDSGSFVKKSSGKETSVGELAAMLADAESRFEVHQVSAKASRALLELKMASVTSDKDEAKKIAQKIRRLEKLMKQIQKKLKNLAKEEQLELRRQRAAKKEEMEKEQELLKELQARRKKRRREDRRYAAKELAEDQKESNAETTDSFFDAGSSQSISPDLSEGISVPGADLSAVFDGASIDIMA